MKWVITYFFIVLECAAFAQSPKIIGHIDSLVDQINKRNNLTVMIIDDTVHLLAAYPEKEIKAYMSGDTLKKAIVTFRHSSRIREVYFGPGEDYENRVIYVKDYDQITNEIFAELYAWDRKYVKSIIVEPMNEDERNHPEKMLNRCNYALFVQYKKKH